MLSIIDRKAPQEAKDKLAEYSKLIEFETEGITYDSVSGHPDIFFCQSPQNLIIAPNLPEKYFAILDNNKIKYKVGKKPVGYNYPQSAIYNAVVTEQAFIHNKSISDQVLLNNLAGQEIMNVRQGYTRCNVLALRKGHFITSDQAIHKILSKSNYHSHYVNPEGIILNGFKNGFFGGTCGIFENLVFVLGNLAYYQYGNIIRGILLGLNYEIIHLYDGPLFDGGGILFIDK